MINWKCSLSLTGALALTCSLSALTFAQDQAPFMEAWKKITGAGLAEHIETLASDEYEGREPGTAGGKKTIEYLGQAFAEAGASPGNGKSFFQDVPLVEVRRDGATALTIFHGPMVHELAYEGDFVAFAGRPGEELEISATDLVFVGYGIDAPEHGWNDYSDVDITGKIVVVMRSEPYKEGDDALFLGDALTRHGIQPTKYDTAAAYGAKGVLLIHTDASAGYPWSVLTGGGVSATQQFIDQDGGESKLEMVIHINEPAARQIFAWAGMDYDEAISSAEKRGFKARPMSLTASSSFKGTMRRIKSQNVLAKINGSGNSGECILYTAHWDHVGTNENLEGDKIFNGAVDNATGTAALIELAEAFATLPDAPRRDVYFLATTAEEKGLLGAEFYADNPVCPLNKTAAVLNLDAHFPFGFFNAMTVPGIGSSEIEDIMAEAAKRIGRVLQPDSNPGAGGYYRSDHYPFAKRGVPAIYAVGSPRMEDFSDYHPMLPKYADYLTNGYHKVGDEYNTETWDLTGIEGDVRVYFETGFLIADDTRFPNWKYGNEFRRLRDDMMSPK